MNSTSNNGKSAAARILIVEDHPVVRRGLVELINAEPDLQVVGEADDAPEAMLQLTQTHPDLVIVDISLKRGNGIDLLKQIRARDGHTRLLVTSVHDESLYAERALRAGAMGYVNKAEPIQNIINAVRQIMKGRIFLSMPMVNRMLQSGQSDAPPDSPIASLSDRELQVFELISRGLTTREIAGKLLLSIKTIETHRDHIRMKLKLKNSTELIHHAVQWFLESNAALKMMRENGHAVASLEQADETTEHEDAAVLAGSLDAHAPSMGASDGATSNASMEEVTSAVPATSR